MLFLSQGKQLKTTRFREENIVDEWEEKGDKRDSLGPTSITLTKNEELTNLKW